MSLPQRLTPSARRPLTAMLIHMACDTADVFTYGFSNRTWEETVEILQAWKIERLVDIRTLPGSKKFPHFNIEHLQEALPADGIEYVYLKALGGFRRTSDRGDENAGWRNASFRNYADYMQTAEFSAALEELIRLFGEKRTVYCCTEAVYWRCHRALVSDALLVRGFQPGHIFTATKCELHKITKFAHVDGLIVTYPPEPKTV